MMDKRRKTLWVCALVGLGAAAAGAANPPVSGGVFRADQLGLIELSTADGRLAGRYVGGGACEYAIDQQVLQGEWEGGVLVGRLFLCQTGANCSDRGYDVLAFYNAVDGSLSANVKLEGGCQSPGLAAGRLRLWPDPQAASAAAAARRKSKPARLADLCRQALAEGSQALEREAFEQAIAKFELAVSLNPDSSLAHAGLGVAQLKRGDFSRSVASLERARDLAKDAREGRRQRADIYYNLACAYARQKDRAAALENLRHALAAGFSDAETMRQDPDLTRLLQNDPDFVKLIELAGAKSSRRTERRP